MQASSNRVPFWVCRPGAVLEFEVFPGEVFQGVVESLAMNGPRSFLAILSRFTDENDVVQTVLPHTKSQRAINVSHAKRVVEHSDAELKFDADTAHLERFERELAKAKQEGIIVRRGHRLVIDGNACYAPSQLRSMLSCYVGKHRQSLGVQPWEMVDFESLLSALFLQGVAHAVGQVTPRHYPAQVSVNTRKLKQFLKRSINRFKCDTRAEEKAQEQLDAELYEQETNREGMSGYPH